MRGDGANGDWRLTDLIDVSTLQSIQDTFARAFGIPTVIVDPAGVNATEITHRLGFCEDLTRTSASGGARCRECDLKAMRQAAESGRPKIFNCWNGLYDCAIPIAPKGEVLGYFLCGQVLVESPDPARYEETARAIGVRPDEYSEALKHVRVLPIERYKASVESMHVLAQMISEQAAAAIDNFQILGEALQAKDDAARLMAELDTILKALGDIASQPDYHSTIEAIGDNLERLIPCDSCLFYVVDHDSNTLVPALVRDPYPEALLAFRPEIGAGIVGTVAATRTSRHIPDASADRDYVPIPGAPIEAESMLVVPMVHKDDLLGVISLSRFGDAQFTEHEFRILSVLTSTQAALAVENARMYERERELLTQYRLLADLGTEFATADSPERVKEHLLLRTAAIFRADACFVASFDDLPDSIRVELRRGRSSESLTLALSGAARLASVRLENDRSPDRSLFEAWASELMGDLGDRIGVSSFLAEPLTAASGVIGGLFVGWKRVAAPPEGERRILSVVAGAAGATLSDFTVHAQTDSSLRRRIRQLQTLARLAERITVLLEEGPILDELLRATVDVGHLSGAAYMVHAPRGWSPHKIGPGLDSSDVGMIVEAMRGNPVIRGVTWLRGGEDGRRIVVVALPGNDAPRTAVAGIAPPEPGGEVDTLLTTLSRYGALAIERARLYERQHEAITRLESANRDADETNRQLKRLLAVHTELTVDVLEGSGLRSVARSLAQLTEAEVAILGARGDIVTEWPAGAGIDWIPEPAAVGSPSTTMALRESHAITAAPAIVEGEALAWVVLRTSSEASEIERAAIEHGALLTALELLRERTTLEVETRLRGGLLEELFSGRFSEDMTLKQGLALGFDLTVPSRVILAEPASEDATRADVEALYGIASERAGAWRSPCMVTVRGNTVVIISQEGAGEEAHQRLEDDLMEALSTRLPRVAFNAASGTRCDSLSSYRGSHTAARRGLDLLRKLGRSSAVFSFRDAGIEHLLLQTTEPEIIVDFTSRYVDPLDHYDRDHVSQLRKTLETFYSSQMNLEEAARRLHVHVSTLRYRLTKIEQLLGVDPRGKARLDIELAILAAAVLTSYRK
jgi:ligand-binding sensor protein/sugar diacid utilization regulator/GAF domain-containing protein